MSAQVALRDADGQCQHHGTTEGCYRCCPRCNYDTHTCPGCGSPVPHGTAACAACDPKPETAGDLYRDGDGYFVSPEAATAHAIHVQGGLTTPAREARRMIGDGGRGAEIGREWLMSRGLPLDGDDEPSQAWQQPATLPAAPAAPVAMTSPMAEPPARTVELDATAASWYQALRFADAEIERLTGVRGRAIERIQDAMGDAQQATVAGQPVVSWKPSRPGRTLDRKALEAAYGADVIAEFDREKKAARPFRVLDVQDGA